MRNGGNKSVRENPTGNFSATDYPPCPLCSSQSKPVFRKSGFPILDCHYCGHRFCDFVPPDSHVASTYDDGYFKGGGAGYPDYLAEGRLLRNQGRRYGKIVKEYAPAGRLLDVGCAAGFLLQGFGDSGWKGTGLEPNATMARYGREVAGLDVRNLSFESFQAQERFDLISMIQVLPHFADPRAAIEKAATLLRPGGHLIVETWDRKSLTAKLFGINWHEYSPPSVLHWFSRLGLERLTENCGFRKIAHGRPVKWLDGAHAKSLLDYKLGNGMARLIRPLVHLAVPDKLPIPYPSEDVFWLLVRRT